MKVTINWEPQPRQLKCLEFCGLDFPFTGSQPRPALADMIGYGGAAGGGKTDTLLAIAIIAGFQYSRIKIAFFRREFPQLEGLGGAIQRSLELLTGICKYNEQKHRWTFPNGSQLQFYHCKDENDVYNYQSQQFDILLVDESTQFTEFQIDYLITRNRATVSYPTFKPFSVMGTNPGNIGHGTFKERFYDIGVEKVTLFTYPTGEKRLHVFVPSKLEDNVILEQRDPGYRSRLSTNVFNKEVLLGGNWEVFAGQIFRFRRLKDGKPYHVIDPQPVPRDAVRFIDIDWGGNMPVAIGWKAVINITTPTGIQFKRIWLYREKYYGVQGQISAADDFKMRENMEFSDVNVAKIIAKLSVDEEIDYVVGDPSMANTKRRDMTSIGESINEAMNNQWIADKSPLFIKPGDNNRKTGLERTRFWLSEAPDGLPYYQVFSTCRDSIRIYPNLPYELGEDDVDTEAEDHIYDRDRYGFMSRPYGAPLPKKKKLEDTPDTFAYHLKKMRQKRLQFSLNS